MKPNSAPSIQQAFESYQQKKPSAELWVGETAAAWDSGKPGVTNAFVDGFWFVTQLGSLAQLGVHTQCRQALVGGAYELYYLWTSSCACFCVNSLQVALGSEWL